MRGHMSECGVNNAPARKPGPCNCGYAEYCEQGNKILTRLVNNVPFDLREQPALRDALVAHLKRPVVVSDDMSADVANETYGEAYGVDWEYVTRMDADAGERIVVDDLQRLQEAAVPMLKLLNSKYHPHVTAIVTPTSVELLEGMLCAPRIFDYVQD